MTNHKTREAEDTAHALKACQQLSKTELRAVINLLDEVCRYRKEAGRSEVPSVAEAQAVTKLESMLYYLATA